MGRNQSAGVPAGTPARRTPLRAAALGASIAVALGCIVATPATAAATATPAETVAAGQPVRFDFGPGAVASGYTPVTAGSAYSPESGFGFAPGGTVTETDRGGDPLRGDFVTAGGASFVVDLANVDYTVSIVAGDTGAATEIAIASEQMGKVQTTSRAAGQFLEMNYDIALVDGQLSFDFSGAAANINAIVITPQPAREAAPTPTAYLTGDSTVQTYDPYWEPQAGWGQMLDQFLTDAVAVDNHAIGGRSSRTFVTEGRLDTVLRSVRPGDYVFAQFGHNDATVSVPERYTTPEQFQGYLRIVVEGARQRGGTPILVTPVNRLDVNPTTGEFNESFPEYVAAMKAVATELDVHLVDLSASSRAYLNEIGAEAAESVFLHAEPGVYPNRPTGVQDNTHFQEYGAIQMARLVALDVAELGLPISEAVEVTVPDALPEAVTGLAVTETSSSSISLSWDAAAGADIYRIYRSPVGAGEFALAATSTVPQKSIGSLAEGGAYDFRVTAVNGLGEGPASDTVSATTRSAAYRYDFQPAGAPVGAGYTEVNRGTVYSAERGYGIVDPTGMIDRDRGASAGDAVARDFVAYFNGRYEFAVDVPNGTYSATATVGDLLGTVRTNVEIEGRDYGGISVSRGTRTQAFDGITVADGQLNTAITGATGHLNGLTLTPILVAPAEIRLDDLAFDGATARASLSWDASPEAAAYRVYRTAPEGTVLVGETEGTSFVDDTAQPGSTVTYAVTTVTARGAESVPSVGVEAAIIDPDVAPPAAPTGLAYGDVQKNSVALTWDATDGALFYLVSRADKNGDFHVIGRADEAAYVDEDVLTTVAYTYRVQAVNAGGASDASATVTTPAVTTLDRAAERLDRAPVAVAQDGGVYLGWRLLGDDPQDAQFHVYRDGARITEEPVTGSTNYVDAEGTADSTYRVAVMLDGAPIWATEEFTPWGDQSLDIPLDKPADGYTKDGQPYSYRANDVSVADLDGDGQLEYVVKWDPTNSKDNSSAGYTGNVYLDAYELDGTKLWRIDLGVNIRAGAHYSQPMVYDLDSDGRAELVVKTADGTKDGTGAVIGDAGKDWRNSSGYILTGPEYLTVFEGTTGRAVDTIDYVPGRGDVGAWGDTYGNRVDRFLAGVAYLDGEHPSVIFSRGYYTRAVVAAFDFDGENLTQRWVFDSSQKGNGGYAGQGNHNLTAADVDADGKDEIVFGSATIDDDGTGLYATGLGHGDALHVSDFDPSRPGLEVYAVHEDMGASGNRGATYRDAATGEVLWGVPAERDTGRGAMADIDPRYDGAEGWNIGGTAAWDSREGTMRNVSGEEISTSIPAANFVAQWDGDLLSEIVDHRFDTATRTGAPVVSKWDYENGAEVPVFEPEGVVTNNDTKGNPALQADLLGDWREELVYRTTDSSALRIFTTTDVTEHRLRTLLSDSQYRLSVAWQAAAYNQPPHTSYYLGEGMATPAAPRLAYTSDAPAPEVAPGPATAVPAKGVLSSTSGWEHGLRGGDYTVTMDLWHGQNAHTIRLYENGELVTEAFLEDATPTAQRFSFEVTGRTNGTYEYTCELVNQHGTTPCKPVTVKVTDANPAKAVLSHDNHDRDGAYTVTANLWWGTNATSYRLYENGELIDEQELSAATPQAQTASTEISGRASGEYRYTAVLANGAGETETKEITVTVK
ncbi:G-D-S-L family lipolytic protein [Microbacterium paludicola]|uniref:G-D-S-L family lipolytic protein n=1 Tax=Microbacterium paludicola TaxID=300019 RepID=A0A4Y9FUV7_9MICO|nr:fibronectin type III domain-containing protein [Microbacterium paludicola]MBF0817259.1 fibronectin type III domain-containing protein [Microbacterium paludicola]TFU32008.1 G-D-S-L family lipolytic protein [Microbacterium paludicola]